MNFPEASNTPDRLLRNMMEALLETSSSGDANAMLVKAAANGDKEKVQELLERPLTDVHGMFNGHTALHQAAHKGHIEVIQVLLKHHVNVEQCDKDGNRPLHLAAYGDEPDVIELLHKAGTDLNARNKHMITPLHFGINKNHIQVVRALLDLGCNPNVQDKDGDTPLHDAIMRDRVNMVYLLMKHGADVTIANNKCFNALHLAAGSGNVGAMTFLLTKLPRQNCVNEKKDDGFTALHMAVFNDNVEMTGFLLDSAKANTDVQTNKLHTPLHLAVAKGNTHIVKLLVRKGCNVNIQDEDGDTPLHDAIKYSTMTQQENVGTLLMKLIGITQANRKSSISIACFLAANGADIKGKNNKSQTPLDLCNDPILHKAILSCQNN